MPERPDADGRTRTALLAHMRHELRTPLNAIIGYSEMLLEDAEALDHPAVIPDLTEIRESGHALLAIVNELLDPSRSDREDFRSFGEQIREQVDAPLKRVLIHTESLM